jgi:hypothetical protein
MCEKLAFMSMEYFWNLLFQLMKHGTNTLHVAFIFLFSVYTIAEGVKQYGKCPNTTDPQGCALNVFSWGMNTVKCSLIFIVPRL